MTFIEPLDLAVAAARAADDKGGSDVMVIDVGDVLGICGYFVIASASNPVLVKALTEAVEERLREEYGQKPRSVEGADGRRWVLLDFSDIVVHVFHVEERDYYRIERLYSDAPTVEWRPEGHPELAGPS
jgi:ribosome-associated protein